MLILFYFTGHVHSQSFTAIIIPLTLVSYPYKRPESESTTGSRFPFTALCGIFSSCWQSFQTALIIEPLIFKIVILLVNMLGNQ